MISVLKSSTFVVPIDCCLSRVQSAQGRRSATACPRSHHRHTEDKVVDEDEKEEGDEGREKDADDEEERDEKEHGDEQARPSHP